MIDENILPDGDWDGKVFNWVRSLDPWHPSAFPDEIRVRMSTDGLPQKSGWMGEDWGGNPVIFVPDTLTK